MLFALLCRPKISAFALTIAAAPALAESPAPTPPADPAASQITLDTVEVISEKLDIARLQIQPSLGASTYYFSPEALETIPQGENAPLNQVLLQMPGVAQDSFGQIHECAIQDTAWNCRRGFRFLDRRSKPALPPAVRSLPAPCRQQKM